MAITIAYSHLQGTGNSLDIYTGQPVVFEASGTTSTNYARPWEELDFVWTVDGGVPSAYTYGDSRIAPNWAIGPVACFLFVTAGTHTITLLVTEPDGTAAAATTDIVVTVTDPSVVLYLDSAAAGGGDGSLSTPYNSWSSAWTALLAADTSSGAELRVARGSTFTLTSGQTTLNTKTGFRRITAYGTGALPAITTNNVIFGCSTGSGQQSDGLIIDSIDLTSTYSSGAAVTTLWASGGVTRSRITSQFEYAIKGTSGATSMPTFSFADQALVDCELIGQDYGVYWYPPLDAADLAAASKRRFIGACTISAYGDSPSEHAIRAQLYYAGIYGVVTNWTKPTAGEKSNIKLTSETASGVATHIYVGYTDLTSGGNIASTFALANDGSGTFANVLVESVRMYSEATNPAQYCNITRTCDKCTFKNVKVILGGNALDNGGQFFSFGGQSHTGFRMLNCTLYDARTGTQDEQITLLVSTGGTPTSTILRNVVMVCKTKRTDEETIQLPVADTAVVVDRCWIDGSDTVTDRLGRFNATNRTFAQYQADNADAYTNINGAGEDPRLDSMLNPLYGSPLESAGADMGAGCPVYRDFYGVIRTHDNMTIGAVQTVGAQGATSKVRGTNAPLSFYLG